MIAKWAALVLLLCLTARCVLAAEDKDGPASKGSVQQHFLGGGYKPYPGYYPGGALYPGAHGYPAVAVPGYPSHVAGGYPAVAVPGYPSHLASGYPAVAVPGYPSHPAAGYPAQAAPGYYPGLGGGLPFVFYNADKDKKSAHKASDKE